MDEEYKNKIKAFYITHSRMPSFGEIATLLGFKSREAVTKLVTRLSRDNFISQDAQGKLIPGNFKNPLKVLGSVQAGFPTIAEESLSDTISLDEFLIKNRESTYVLTVRGDSMKNAGIIEGDLVLADRKVRPEVGNIVIANVDGEYTMKYLRIRNGRYFLEAAHEQYPNIYPKEDMSIQAVVVGIVRTYRK